MELPTNLKEYLEETERQVLKVALDLHNGNRTQAGRALGLTLRQMRYRMEKLGMAIVVVKRRQVLTPFVGRNSAFRG